MRQLYETMYPINILIAKTCKCRTESNIPQRISKTTQYRTQISTIIRVFDERTNIREINQPEL